MSDKEKLFRYDVLFSFLKSGDPLESIDAHRPMLEKHVTKITESTHLTQLLPIVNGNEIAKIKEEMEHCNVHIIFAGASFDGECFCMMYRWIKNWQIMQRVVRVNILVKSMKNGNITTEIIDTSSRVYGLQPNQIRGMSYDRASPNLTAVQTLRLLFPQSEFFPCISHTITHAGEHFWIPNLTVILHALRGLFSHSKQAKTLWRNLALTVFPSYCDTRWWSEYEEILYMFVHTDLRDTFILDAKHGDLDKSSYVNTYYNFTINSGDEGELWELAELEMCAVVEGGRPLVQATYFLEGDGLCILYCYDWLMHLDTTFNVGYYPLIDEFIAKLVRHDPEGPQKNRRVEHLKSYAMDVLEEGYRYFRSNVLAGDVGQNLELFRLCRVFNPAYVKEMFTTFGADVLKVEIRGLSIWKHITAADINQLLATLPEYIQVCTQYAGDWLFKAPSTWATFQDVKSFKKKTGAKVGLDIMTFFEHHQQSIQHWAAMAAEVFLHAPSSAAVERVFSFLRDKFDKGSLGSLIDYIETSLMLKANGSEVDP